MSDRLYPVQDQEEASRLAGTAEPVGGMEARAPVVLTDSMIRSLKGAAPWLRFLGILTFISCGVLGLSGLILTLVSFITEDFLEELGGFGGVLIGLLYIALGVLFIFPGRFTYNFGARIRNFLLGNSGEELELALKNNKSLWKFYGILSIVYLAMIPVAIVALVIVILNS
ncbi:MAG: hypothetical protein LBU21_03750 [Treponema sp.]|jgi:hypothetical protein|nr:hypothetical protein [Treponema sp.]